MFIRTAVYSIAFSVGFGSVGAYYLLNAEASQAQAIAPTLNTTTQNNDNRNTNLSPSQTNNNQNNQSNGQNQTQGQGQSQSTNATTGSITNTINPSSNNVSSGSVVGDQTSTNSITNAPTFSPSDNASSSNNSLNLSVNDSSNYRYPVQFPLLTTAPVSYSTIGNVSCSGASMYTNAFGMHQDNQGANFGGVIGVTAPISSKSKKACTAALELQNRAMQLQVQILEAQYRGLQETRLMNQLKPSAPVSRVR